jgi:Ca-activated chloride channel family protein
MKRYLRSLALLLLFLVTQHAAGVSTDFDKVVLWPERQRSFLQDGPELLLSDAQVDALEQLDEAGRSEWIDGFLEHDPDPSTSANELQQAIQRRQALVRQRDLSPRDVRAQLLFLHGVPQDEHPVDCSNAFQPLEIWTYGTGDSAQKLVLYRPRPTLPFRLWVPWDTKGVLYTPEMEYYLQQWEALHAQIRPGTKRFDRQLCPDARLVDRVTGVDGLRRPLDEAPSPQALRAMLAPPDDLDAWALKAAKTPLEEVPPKLEVTHVEFFFPQREGQRLQTRVRLTLPADSPIQPYTHDDSELKAADQEQPPKGDEQEEKKGEKETQARPTDEKSPSLVHKLEAALERRKAAKAGRATGSEKEKDKEKAPEPPPPPEFAGPQYRLVADGFLEQSDGVFETIRVRFRIPVSAKAAPEPLALVLNRLLRPDSDFVLRLRIRDEVSGATGYVARGFHVPKRAQPVPQEQLAARGAEAIAEELGQTRIEGADSLRLVPPGDEVVLGLWRAEALVTGSRIQKVVFLVDGKSQFTRTRPPFTAEVGLANFPKEQVVRAEGYDAKGELVAADEVVLNQPRGAFQVRIREPARGHPAVTEDGRLDVRAEVIVPENRKIERVEFQVNDKTEKTLTAPPWQAKVAVPTTGEITYLTVAAWLDNGERKEDLRILNAPGFMGNVNVQLVELLTTVTDGAGHFVRGLPESAFQVFEDGQPQTLQKFEEVENLPLSLGITIDTSGSMGTALPVAIRAASDFLDHTLTPKDTCFAVGFSDKVRLIMPPTDDAVALKDSFKALHAEGWTKLHDAVVASLYYFRGIRGRRALIVLSDGDDTSSRYGFPETLEFARRSGVAIYTIALNVGGLGRGARRDLAKLAEETGGRTFVIGSADELKGVYKEIETELRSQYLLAYESNQSGGEERFRKVEVKVKGGKARTIRGYYR